jgi:hypothetical protein
VKLPLQRVVNAGTGDGGGLCISQRNLLARAEVRGFLEPGQVCQLGRRDVALERRCGVEVDTEGTPVDLRNPHSDQRAQPGFDGRRLAIDSPVEQRQGEEGMRVASPQSRGLELAAVLSPL